MPFDWTATVGETPKITGTINVVARKATATAPESIFFEVDLDSLSGISVSGPGGSSVPSGSTIYDPRFYQLDFRWDFGDPGSYANVVGRVQPLWQNSNFADTCQAAHCFKAGGTYTVTCRVTDPATGGFGILAVSVAVADENTLYPTTQTIVVDPNSTGLAASYPGSQNFSTLDSAIAAYTATSETTPIRMVLARGQTYPASVLRLTSNSNTAPTLYLRAADGAGSDPVIQSDQTFGWADNSGTVDKDLTVQNIRFSGIYNAEARLPPGEDPAITINERPPHITLDSVSIRNHQTLVRPTVFAGLNVNLHINDCDFEGWHGYGMIGGFNRLAISGTRWHQSPDMWRNDPATGDPYGAIRLPKANRLLLHGTSFYIGLTRQRRQGGLRLFTSQLNNDWRATLSGCEITGATECITFGSQNGSPRPVGQALIQNCYIAPTYESQWAVNHWRAGLTFRSNIFNMPEVTQTNRNWNGFISTNDRDTITAENIEPNFYLGNTFIATAENTLLSSDFSSFPETRFDNNVFIDSADTSDGPIIETAYVTPVEQGEILTSGTATRTAGTATPVDDQYIPTPQIGSGAATGATGTVAAYNMPYRDFFGSVHGGAFKGAIPPA